MRLCEQGWSASPSRGGGLVSPSPRASLLSPSPRGSIQSPSPRGSSLTAGQITGQTGGQAIGRHSPSAWAQQAAAARAATATGPERSPESTDEMSHSGARSSTPSPQPRPLPQSPFPSAESHSDPLSHANAGGHDKDAGGLRPGGVANGPDPHGCESRGRLRPAGKSDSSFLPPPPPLPPLPRSFNPPRR